MSLNLAFRRLLSLPTNGHSLESDPYSVFNCLSVCLSVCSDDNDTKCSKLLRASLRGTSGRRETDLALYLTLVERQDDFVDDV